MPLIFEEPAPYDLPGTQTASAYAADENVVLTLTVCPDGKRLIPVRTILTARMAVALLDQLKPAATTAELNALKKP